MTDELLPCPFCGGKANIEERIHKHFDEDRYFAVCISCACEGAWATTKSGAVRGWNSRVIDGKPADVVMKSKYTDDIQVMADAAREYQIERTIALQLAAEARQLIARFMALMTAYDAETPEGAALIADARAYLDGK